ncbi:hypothetical protein, partial [Mycolicibacterium sp. CBMA 361]
ELLLSRIDCTLMPVRDYSREFTTQRKVAGLKAIPSARSAIRTSAGCGQRASRLTWSRPDTATPSG